MIGGWVVKHFVLPGAKRYNEIFYPARDQKGTMKHFEPPGAKRYNETFCAARDQIARDM